MKSAFISDMWHSPIRSACFDSGTLWLLVFPERKVHGAIMGPIWGRQDAGGPHVTVGPMNVAIWVVEKGNTNKNRSVIVNITELYSRDSLETRAVWGTTYAHQWKIGACFMRVFKGVVMLIFDSVKGIAQVDMYPQSEIDSGTIFEIRGLLNCRN